MRVFSNGLLPLLFFVLIICRVPTAAAVVADGDSGDDVRSPPLAAPLSSDTTITNHRINPNNVDNTNNNNINNDNLEDEVMHETIATGRGERDAVGHREEWSSNDHLRESSRFDTRRPMSSHVMKKLQFYRLECDGCDHREAVAKINDFVLDAKREAELQRVEAERRRSRRNSWIGVVVKVVTGGVILCVALGVYFLYQDVIPNDGSYTLGDFSRIIGNSSGGGGGRLSTEDKRRLQIEDQRQKAAAQQQSIQSQQLANANAPTWIDNEMMEVWTPKQEKQFDNALVMYGGMAAKARYKLISENVEGKSRQECLMHHKLRQVIAKEQ